MKLLRGIARLGRFFTGATQPEDPNHSIRRVRICRFEQMESRKLMAADLHLGGVYFEEASGDDSDGDTIQITFNGGQPGTQLTRLEIDGDKLGDGLNLGDIFFDTAAGGRGSFGSYPFSVVSSDGFTITNVSVADGSSKLVLEFSGFDAGEKLVFKIDVDEQGFIGSTSVTEGGEFEGSKLIGTFTNPHYETATGTAIFFDQYDQQIAQNTAASGKPLNLPTDNYIPPHNVDRSDRTAGGSVVMEQVAKPITISGTVYSDPNLNNRQDTGEQGLSGVSLTLLKWNGTAYVSTGKTAVTNAAGNYTFDGVLPGKYRIVETQPNGYFSVGASAGTVGGQTRGTVTSPDIISEIDLLGGQDSIDNDFAEALPATLSGNVYHDRDNDGRRDAGEEGIGGVTIVIQPVQTLGNNSGSMQVVTNSDGSWSINGLAPGTYRVYELAQPAGYLDGLDRAGNAGGSAVNPGDEINGISLAGGQAGTEYNFGELLPSIIRGRVHADQDGDCVFDPNESPIAGVTVELLDANGQVIATTKTNANGEYEFTGLRPGSYGVREIQPAGYFDGGDHIGTAGGVKSANDTITAIVLTSGTSALQYNFCEKVPLTLSGYVYVDDNNNGIFDAGERPLANVELELLDGQGRGTGIKVRTDANGFYKFEGLNAGTYGVREFQPTGYFDGLDTVGNSGGTAHNPGDMITGLALVFGKNGKQYNFGELRPTSITGRVHADPESDCVFGPNDIPLAGVKIHLLDAGGSIIDTTFTNEQGIYKFENLAPGTYGILEVQPAGYFHSAQHIGSAGGVVAGQDKITQIVLGSGVDAVDYNFCEDLPVSLAGYVYADNNNNGVRDTGERGIRNVTLELLDSRGRGTGITVVTDRNGFYKFDGLAPGVYGVRETQPAGYYDGLDSAGSAGGVAENPGDRITGAVLDPTVHGVNYNFGELKPGSISGRVHADRDGDCEYDEGERPIAGVVIHLLDADGNIIRTTTTDSEGRYTFANLAPGTYGILEVQPEGFFDGGEFVGSAGGVKSGNDRITQIGLMPGVAAVNYNFCEKPPASLSGRVHADLDGDCTYDPGEQPIAGVKIELLDADGEVIRTTFTDARGRYTFDNLPPGTYSIREVQPSGYFDGGEFVGTAGGVKGGNDLITQINLLPGFDGTDYNFCEKPPASISGYVYTDFNNNCVVDAGERGIAGVVIELLDAEGRRTGVTTATDANGFYQFTGLAPGVYGVLQVQQPQGYIDGKDCPGSAGGTAENPGDKITAATLTPGTSATNYNFGEIVPGKISGYVYQDGSTIQVPHGGTVDYSGRDGRRTGDDQPLSGVVLQLGDEFGNPILDSRGRPIVAITDSRGYYEFSGLMFGTYSLRQVQPEGYVDYLDTVGSTGGVAINPGAEIDPDLAAKLADGVLESNDAIVMITVRFGQDSENNNFSEVRLVQLPPPPQVGQLPYEPKPAEPIIAPPLPVIPPPVVAFMQGALYIEAPALYYAGTRGISGHTWHLSVIDGGFPRGEAASAQPVAQLTSATAEEVSWSAVDLRRGAWTIQADAGLDRRIFGMPGGMPVTGDFNGDGISEVGIFVDGQWYIDVNGNGVWDAGDLWAKLGTRDDLPVVGDWDGDGKDDIGIFGPAWAGDPRAVAAEPGLPDPNNAPTGLKNVPPKKHDAALGKRTLKMTATGQPRADLIDHVFNYGKAGDEPVTGDWSGDGIDTIAVFNNGTWHMDIDGDGQWSPGDLTAEFGQRGDVPIVGDWNGDGTDDIGVFRSGKFYLDMNKDRALDARDQVFEMGGKNSVPVAGDFNGDGTDEVAVYDDSLEPAGERGT